MIKYREAFKISRERGKKGALSSRLESNLAACAKVSGADGILMEADQFSRVDV